MSCTELSMEGTDWDTLWKRDQVQKRRRRWQAQEHQANVGRSGIHKPRKGFARHESFTPLVSEALFAVEMNTVSMRTGDVQQLDNACVRNCLILRPAISRSLSEQELLCKKSVAVEPCR